MIFNEVYDKLDLSQYSSWGHFAEDGLMWVEKSDYTGKQFGYINYKGEVAIPFTSEIAYAYDFVSSYAIVSYGNDEIDNG